MTQTPSDGRARAVTECIDTLKVVDAHLDMMMGDGSGMPFQTFLSQTALIRGQVKALLTRLAEGG